MTTVSSNSQPARHGATPIIRLLIAAFAVVSFAASAAMWVSTGSPRSPERNGLLFGPSARFSDLRDLISAGLSGHPYGQVIDGVATAGPSYPPGLFALTRILVEFSEVGAQRALILATGLAIALLAGPIMCAALSRKHQWAAGAIALGMTILTAEMLEWYCVLLMTVAAALTLLLVLSVRREAALTVIGLPILLGASFPVAFAIDRMNVDVVIFQLMTLALLMLRRGHGNVAAAAFGAAVAVKIYPLYFAILDYSERGRIRRAVIAAGTGVTVTTLGLLGMDYSIQEAVSGFNRSVVYFEQNYIIASSGMPYGASLLTAVRILYRESGHTDVNAFTASIYPMWKTWSPILLGVLAAMTVFLRTSAWCRMMVMTCALLALSPNTGMYRATMILIPVAMWIGHLTLRRFQQRATRLEWLLSIFVGVGLAPLTFWEVMGFESTVNVTSQTLLAPFVYLAVLALAMTVGLQERNLVFSRQRRSPTLSTSSALGTSASRAEAAARAAEPAAPPE